MDSVRPVRPVGPVRPGTQAPREDQMPAAPAQRILIVDDDQQILRVLRISLRARGYATETAASASAALAAAERNPPDLVVLDLGLPDLSGVAVVTSLRRWSTVPIIVLSGSALNSDKVLALDAGADDFVSKPFDIEELLARMRAALRRAADVPDLTTVTIGGHAIDLAARTVAGPGGHVELTPTEWQLLHALVRRAGRLVSQAELAAEVPGRARSAGGGYLRVHLMHLRQKLEADPVRPAHLITEPGLGYRFLP